MSTEKKTGFARAVDVKVKVVYGAAVRPGYACWVSLWKAEKG